MWEFINVGMQECRDLEIEEGRNAECKNVGVQECRTVEIYEFMNEGMQECWNL